ncbi:MAG TPA: DUF3108 domain-containing protein [Pyrinomonadaceae bacterium]
MKDRRVRFVVLSLLLCTLLLASAPASETKRKDTGKLPFEPTEELVYEGEFTRAILRGVNIAELRFTANRTQLSSTNQPNGGQQQALRFTVEAETKGILSKLFKINYHQRVESTVEPNSFSVLQTTKLDEQGKRKRTSEAVFDKAAGKVVWTERDPTDPTREPRVVTNPASGAVQDIASAFYYLRTQPLELGRRFEILISDSGQVYRIPVAVTERKKMKTVLGQVQTLRVEPEIFGEDRLVRGKGKISIWFTDDARRVPVRARINNEMGTLDIKLKSMSGAR